MKNKQEKVKKVTISELELMILDRFMESVEVELDSLSIDNRLHPELEDQFMAARAIVQEKYRDVRG